MTGLNEPRHQADPELARGVARGLRSSALAANAAGAVIVFATLTFLGPGEDLAGDRVVELVGVFVAFLALVFPPFSVILSRIASPMYGAISRGEPLTGRARSLALASPWLNASVSMFGWLLAAGVFSAYSAIRLENTALEVAALAVTLVLGGLATIAVVYLLSERAVRPVLALAFHIEPPERVRGVAVRPRLLLSWALGGAVPLLMIGVALTDPEADAETLRNVGWALVSGGLVAGWVVTARAARSVADPLASVRRAMRSVREGDLDTSVEVDDATEIGLLQAGFNEMAAGLRERERLRDLFGRHVGTEVAGHALERGVALGGEVREASALFVDLTGSTALSVSRSPQEVVGLLNEFFAAVVGTTEAEGGWVNKFEGDAALCVFGVPADQPDHAARALRAARVLAQRLGELRDRYPELDAGIGVSSGEVVAGNVGAEQRYEYTVIGDPVNEAARLSDEAKGRPSRVLAAEPAIVRAGSGEPTDGWWEAATFQLRGRTEPTRTFEPA